MPDTKPDHEPAALPNAGSELIGLSKYARLTSWTMSRPHIREEALVRLADELEARIRPDGLAVVMAADPFCTHRRGSSADRSAMTRSAMRGAFLRHADLRRDALSARRSARG